MLAQVLQTQSDVTVHWYQEPWGYGLLLLASVVLAIALGAVIARASKMEDSWWRFSLVFGTLLVSLVVLMVKWPPKYGVDLKGGTIIIGQVEKSALDSGTNTGSGDSMDPAKNFEIGDLIRLLKNRIDPTGLKEIVIKAQGDDKIEVVIPDVEANEAERIWKKMTTIGFLQFRIVATNLKEGPRAQELAREQSESPDLNIRRSRIVTDANSDGSTEVVARWYNLGRVAPSGTASEGTSLPYKYVPGPTAMVRDAATGKIVSPQLYSGVPGEDDFEMGKALKERAEAAGISQLQVLLLEPIESLRVDGEHVQTVFRDQQNFDPIVSFIMTSEGARRMGRFTEVYRASGQAKLQMGVVLDGNLMTAPSLNTPIAARGMIEGNFTLEEVEDLVTILNAGRIPVALKKDYISLDSIQSSLGEELKQKGIFAIVGSLAIVLVFMLIYYWEYSGAIACFVLLMNVVLVGALMMLVGQALTLTGLAGFVLTVGMSVDANVLIFERIREETEKGTAIRMAIRNGFDRAMSTIIDANVTTLITAVVLYVIGQEQIKSFAVVLILGILSSMFTAIFVARLIFDWLEKRRMIRSLRMFKIFDGKKMNVMGLSPVAVTVSLILIAVGIVAMFARGGGIFDYDLRGGSTARTVFVEKMDQFEITKQLAAMNIKDATGEPVQFSTAPLDSADYPSGTYFKIESTLALPDNDTASVDFEDLKAILKRQFGDKLLRLEVEASDITMTPIGGSAAPASSDAPATSDTKSSGTKTSDSLKSDASISSSRTFKASPGGQTQSRYYAALTWNSQQDGSQGAESETTEQAGGESAQDPASETTPGSETSALPDLPTIGNPALDQIPDLGTAGQAPDNTAVEDNVPIASQQMMASLTFTFKLPVASETVAGQLLAAANSMDIALAEENIIVKATDGGNRATKFDVQMQVPDQAAAEKIVQQVTTSLNSEPFFPSASSVGGQVAGQAQLQALGALLASLVGIVFYIYLRFQHIWFGLAAVVALLHDVLIVLGAIAISFWLFQYLGFLLIDNFKISLSVVAALLTVVGYSLNDTIVVFDRIREVRGRSQKFTADMINVSIGQTLSRTILTSLTTFVVVAILYGFGGDSIHAFAFALTVGILVGTYSSIFIASPVLLWLMNTKHIDIAPVGGTEEK